MSPSSSHAARGAMLAGLLLLASGCAPGSDEQGYVVLDAAAREAGLAVSTAGEIHAGPLPIAVAPGALAALVGEGRRERLDVASGETLHVWGSSGFRDRGVARSDELRIRGEEGPVRAFVERLGAEALPDGAGRWIVQGPYVLSTAALFDEAPGVTAVEPVYVTRAEGDRDPLSGGEDPTQDGAGPAGSRRMAIELEVTIALPSQGPAVFQVGDPIPVHAELVSRAWGARWVVKPGDGSEVGWREPHVFYTAEREERHGVWVDAPQRQTLRCGNFDSEWEKDVVSLEPGASLDLDRWVVPPERAFDLQPGRFRIYAHYQYRAGTHDVRFGQRVPRALLGIPDYEVVSAPMDLRIVRPRSDG